MGIQERNYATQMREKIRIQLEKRIQHPKLELKRILQERKASIRKKLDLLKGKEQRIQ